MSLNGAGDGVRGGPHHGASMVGWVPSVGTTRDTAGITDPSDAVTGAATDGASVVTCPSLIAKPCCRIAASFARSAAASVMVFRGEPRQRSLQQLGLHVDGACASSMSPIPVARGANRPSTHRDRRAPGDVFDEHDLGVLAT